ncbi:MAG: LysM peptidoglycan-binding domain-containing protein [bacterium]
MLALRMTYVMLTAMPLGFIGSVGAIDSNILFTNPTEKVVIETVKVDNLAYHSDSFTTDSLKSASGFIGSTMSVQSINDTEPILLASVQGDSLMKFSSPTGELISTGFASKQAKMINYIVRPGDTLSSIASAYNVSPETIFTQNRNKLASSDRISIGDELEVPNYEGLAHTVKSGESVASIASKYGVSEDSIISFNDLNSASDISAGDVLHIKNAKNIPSASTSIKKTTATQITRSAGSNSFPYGYCTYYVASKRNVVWSGNAKSWLTNAARAGYAIGKTPETGSIVVTYESGWGHVAYVESVNGDGSFTVSEMNYVGWGVVNTRTMSAGSGMVAGFIY